MADTKATPKFAAGQPVWLIDRRWSFRQRTTVTKVGRLYFSVEHSRTQFAIDTGFEKGDRYGNGRIVRTFEDQAALDRQTIAERALQDAGLQIGRHGDRRAHFDVEVIEALTEVATGKLPAQRIAEAERELAVARSVIRALVHGWDLDLSQEAAKAAALEEARP